MVPVFTTVACVITLLISLVLPVAAAAVFALKNKKQNIIPAWLLGAAGFFVTQILIRLPILTALQMQPWFADFARNHLFAYAFTLAFTAGLFELAGRFAVAKLMEKKLTCSRALAAGLGHGGIEAMALIGMTYVNNLLYIFMINAGTFDTILAQAAGMGADTASLEMIRQQLLHTSPGLFLLAGFERLLTMICHVAMSMVVCRGVARKNVWPSLLMCLGIHTMLDLSAGIAMAAPQKIAYPVIYAILVAVTVVSMWIIRYICRSWKEEKYAAQE